MCACMIDPSRRMFCEYLHLMTFAHLVAFPGVGYNLAIRCPGQF